MPLTGSVAHRWHCTLGRSVQRSPVGGRAGGGSDGRLAVGGQRSDGRSSGRGGGSADGRSDGRSGGPGYGLSAGRGPGNPSSPTIWNGIASALGVTSPSHRRTPGNLMRGRQPEAGPAAARGGRMIVVGDE